ncbi:hypothetical protein FHX74_001207 [Friedmanniella endophytica]|uniref:RNA polymerase sigma-70 region 4 domain-containing protein n=1 Tax=Microlunatus kandeliicorticis TaxID=1759536 RepID=A0A7W3P585_9ACTN|nr:sigma-70 family RNA polymerase sigma factor [Microlunatus kandeliicorticis]MBA8793602.1 hypothetical protein [Microlunatus kandeliicorticis]
MADRPERQIADWADEPRLADCRTPADVLARVGADPDPVLGRLIRAEQEGGGTRSDPSGPIGVAALVLLRAMVPKMIRMAHRDPSADLDDYLTHLWVRVRTYPLERRPRRIAANLALDTLKAVRSEGGGPDDPVDQLGPGLPGWVLGTPEPGGVSATAVIASAAELGLLDPQSQAVLHAVYVEGRPGADVAERLRISHAMVRYRCSRAVRRLAAHAGELAAA